MMISIILVTLILDSGVQGEVRYWLLLGGKGLINFIGATG